MGAYIGAGASLAHANKRFPNRAIKLVVAFPAGGPTDLTMRQLAENAAKVLGQPIVVENRPGAAGSLPAAQLQNTVADGYTIAQLPMSVMRLPFTTGLKWNPVEDLSYIINVTGYAFCMVASTQSGLKNWQEVVAWAKAHPGKLTLGNTGTYTSPHVTSAIIAQQLGLDVVHVPYKGSAELMRATMAGEVMVAADTSAVIPYVDQGRMVALNVWTEKRLPTLPNTPTLIELGLPTTQYSPFGLVGPKGMPADVQATLHKAFKEAMEMESYQAMLQRFEMLPIYMNSADYKKFAAESTVKEKAVLAKLGPQA
ncbi:tripartite tricarboxylate transporter substrate binding protein [Comamonas sp. B21-038]|uniref:tripartite tricarboxylate transporter substrate binding protein n=1 Tax=Comamonas sp. B21-038 TaxID=2918299 RepID=UPI001EFB1711|nr:tripartite tricarboxylate transporter substrate binding protein [Comamonas sp. B21-038]ULR90796.1 tripartite tricarboxylate transporter substrate binding protein [Comamonas sp. B21-038]